MRNPFPILVFCLLCLVGCASALTPIPPTSAPLLASPTALASPALPTPTSITPAPTASATATVPPPTATVPPAPSSTPVSTAPISATRPTPLQGAALLAAMRQGGYIIALRHAITDRTQTDARPENLQDCSAQRNLNQAGRAQARAIGAAITALRIPIGAVLASPYCRTRETAELAFGRAEITLDLNNAFINADQREELYAKLRQRLGVPPPPGENTVLVTHGDNITGASGVSVAEGEAAIFRPDGSGGFVVVARLTSDAWQALAAAP